MNKRRERRGSFHWSATISLTDPATRTRHGCLLGCNREYWNTNGFLIRIYGRHVDKREYQQEM